jgi:enoyl-CoA hydratase/carnithine racemase
LAAAVSAPTSIEAGDCVTLERSFPHLAIVTLNRPEARNAINGCVATTLARFVTELDEDPSIRCVILTGAGDQAFSAGADLKEVAAGRMETLSTADSGFAGFVTAKRSKPWIAAVNGFALAGGFEIALACDMIVAADDAVFGLPEVTRGLIAAAGGVYRLARRLPQALAFELIATGNRIDAHRAVALGLVNHVVPRADTRAAAVRLALTIAANAPLAVVESLAITRRAYDLEDAALYRLSADAQARIMLTEDFKEGPRAFIEKRPARWLGR